MERNTVDVDATVKYWFAEFRSNRASTNDTPRSGRPQKSVTPENNAKIREIVLSGHKIKLIKFVNIIGISKEWVNHFIDEFMQMKRQTKRHAVGTRVFRASIEKTNVSDFQRTIWQ